MNLAIAELALAGAIWGFSFVAAAWALESMGFLSVMVGRFVLAVVCGTAWACLARAHRDLFNRKQFLLAMIPGLLLSLTLILQTWGLRYTSPTRSGFITCLYILFVPMLEAVFLKKRLSKWHFVFVAMALIGTALICGLQNGGGWNKGDVLTLLCAICASGQILYLSVIADQIGSSVSFNTLQGFWALLLPLALWPFFETFPVLPLNAHALIGLFTLGVASSTFAFALQIRAQKKISASTASMLFLLESPFAMLFSVLLMKEILSSSQITGATLILFSVALATQVGVKKVQA